MSAPLRSNNIFEHLHEDHEHLTGSLRRLTGRSTDARQATEFAEVKAELEAHAKAEDETLYAIVADNAGELVAEARRQHATITTLLDAMSRMPNGSARWAAILRELTGAVERHIAYEEAKVFVAARRVLTPDQVEQLVSRVAASEADKKASAAEPHTLARERPRPS
jgi:hemerythrin superfamily protein